MPLYTFELLDGEHLIEDETGLCFADREDALAHAQVVARELMSAREQQTRCWRLAIYENGECVEEMPFVRADRSLDHLRPSLRETIELSCEIVGGFRQIMSAARATMRESRALVAISRGKPYIVTEAGQPTITPDPPTPSQQPPEGNRQMGG